MYPNVAVVIPFFQRERGLLHRAVSSVLSQKDSPAISIVIVDDGSPVSARDDLGDLASHPQILLLQQENGGAALARNTALDHVLPSTDIVAFLDSDDWWSPVHLEKIVAAFNAGAEFYFCDYTRDERTTTFQVTTPELFSIEPFRKDIGIAWLDRPMFDLVIGKCPLAPSTCAYSWSKGKRVRFDSAFRRSCEDRKFFAGLSMNITKVAFSTNCDVHYGIGVNIFGSAIWGTIAGAERVLDTARFHLGMSRCNLSDDQRALNDIAIVSLDREFAENVSVSTLRAHQFPFGLVSEYANLRPGIWTVLGSVAIRLAWKRIAG